MMRAIAGGGQPDLAQARAPVPQPAPEAECPRTFEDLIVAWAEGFDPGGRAHWDSDGTDDEPPPTAKGDMLRDVAISRKSGKVLSWVAAQGGLTKAVHQILGGDPATSRAVAVNVTQVASILFPDLADLLEHFDPYED